MKKKTQKRIEQIAKFIAGTLIIGTAFFCFDVTRLPFWRVALGILFFIIGTRMQLDSIGIRFKEK